MTPQKGPKKMDKKQLQTLLEQVANGGVKPEEALLQIKTEPYKDMGFAKLDTHRGIRQGMAEVIYGAGKTKEQILKIAQAMLTEQEKTVLITRMSQEAADYVKQYLDLKYDEMSRTGRIGKIPTPDGAGKIVIATGGTSDMPVAEEAALTAEIYGNEVIRLYDVGVAGMHRLVIAVPTSVGYGANFGGLSALLSMLNSCASGISVVNIDNGFGAGYLASMINHLDSKKN